MKPRVLQHDEKGDGEPIVLVPEGSQARSRGYRTRNAWPPLGRPSACNPSTTSSARAVSWSRPTTTTRWSASASGRPWTDLAIDTTDVAAWSGGARAAIEFSLTYPERIRSLTLIEPPALWALRDPSPEVDAEIAHLDAFIERVSGKPTTEDDLAEFLVMAGFVQDPSEARAHPMWERWLPHRGALANQGTLGRKARSLEEVESFERPVLLVKGTRSSTWLGEIVDALGRTYPRATVLDLEGSHACHIERIDEFLPRLEEHLSNV